MKDSEGNRDMQDVPQPYARFRNKFPELLAKNEDLGTYIHEQAGPLDEKIRCLIKLGISAAARHQTAVATQVKHARQAGATEAEIEHALLLVIPTCGFPTFMQAYQEYAESVADGE